MKLLEAPRRLGSNAWSACQRGIALVLRLAERAWLKRITLLRLHVALGQRIAAAGQVPQLLAAQRDACVQLQQSLAHCETVPGTSPLPNSSLVITRTAKRLHIAFRRWYAYLRSVPTRLRIAITYRSLGHTALKSFGKKAVPSDLQPSFIAALTRKQQLESEVSSLWESLRPETPATRAMAASAIAFGCLALILCGWRFAIQGTSPAASTDIAANSAEPASTFRFNRPLQQSAAATSPWRIEDDTGLSDSAFVINEAIATALGAESFDFTESAFRGIPLRTRFKDIERRDWKYPTLIEHPYLGQMPPPQAENERRNPRLSETRVGIDNATGRIVVVMARMKNTEIRDIQEDLIAQFGRTPQDIEQTAYNYGDSVLKNSVIKYTFPESLVRITTSTNIPLRSGYPSTTTAVWVLDRSYVEKNARAFANACVSACVWMQEVRDLYDGERGIVTEIMPPLVDTKVITDGPNPFAIFVDPALERESDRVADLNKKAVMLGDRVPSVNRLVAGVGSFKNGECVIVARPAIPSTNGMDRLLTPRTTLSPYTIQSCAISDIYWHIASAIAQKHFPPSTTKISVIDPQEKNYAARWEKSQPIANQVTGLYQSTVTRRHEWVDEDGWVVKVNSWGSISLSKRSR